MAFSQNPRKIPSLIVVAADGTGDFKTVQEAVDRIPENNQQRILIRIKRGVYNEQIRVSSGKRYLTLRGEDPSNTVLTYSLSAQQAGNTRLAFSTFVNVDDFRAENLTFGKFVRYRFTGCRPACGC